MTTQATRRTRSFRPSLSNLEDRRLMSLTTAALPSGNLPVIATDSNRIAAQVGGSLATTGLTTPRVEPDRVDTGMLGVGTPIGQSTLGTTSLAATPVPTPTSISTSSFLFDAPDNGRLYQASGQGSTTAGAALSNIAEPAAATPYSPVSGSLFGTNGPSYLDVQQGKAGDCWLLSSFAAVAARYPSAIQNMFTYSGSTVRNGSNVAVFKVRFYDTNNMPRYVAVDTLLPSGGGYYDHPANGVLWVALAEKAYAEANGAGYVTTKYRGQNSYAALNGGQADWAIQAITGQSALSGHVSNFSNLASAWASGKIITLGSDANPTDGRILSMHVYAMVGYNASSNTPVTLYNPWGIASSQRQQVLGRFSANNGFLAHNFDHAWVGSRAAGSDEATAARTMPGVTTAPRVVVIAIVPDAATAAAPAPQRASKAEPRRPEGVRVALPVAARSVSLLGSTEMEHRRILGLLSA